VDKEPPCACATANSHLIPIYTVFIHSMTTHVQVNYHTSVLLAEYMGVSFQSWGSGGEA